MAMSNNLDIFDDLCKNLALIIDEIKDEEHVSERGGGAEEFSLQTFWLSLNAGMQSMSSAATKLCLAFSPQPLTTAEEARPLLLDIERSALSIVSTYSALPLSLGKTLRHAVAASVSGMIVAALSLVQSISTQLQAYKSSNNVQHCQKQGKKTKRSTHLQMTGLTWDYADKFSQLPPDNGAAVSLKAKEYLGLISDALDEIEEALSDAHNDDEPDIISDDEDDAMITHRWSDADRELATACTQLLKAAKSCTKKIITVTPITCTAAEPQATAVGEITALDDVAEQLSAVSPAADELIESLYPPVNIPTLRLHVERLCQCLHSTLSSVRALLQVRQQQAQLEWVEFLEKAVDHNRLKIYSLVDSMHSNS